VNTPMSHQYTALPDWFARQEVAFGIFHIWEPYYRDDYRCNIYVIPGTEGDLVLDTGLGLGALRPYLATLAPSPLLVLSHGHYDHIGSAFEFERRVIHSAEAAILAAPTPQNTYADLLLAAEDFSCLPWNGFTAQDWVAPPASATGLIGEGDTLDLGNRRFDVLHTPGHSWGSICLWEPDTGFLFCADTVYDGEIFDQLPSSDIPTYRKTMRRLREYPVQTAFPGHGPILDGEAFRRVIDTYLASTRRDND
jgi:glyoxylase-like metal-dependent hydrolase (beta-lactamase superfamily II)